MREEAGQPGPGTRTPHLLWPLPLPGRSFPPLKALLRTPPGKTSRTPSPQTHGSTRQRTGPPSCEAPEAGGAHTGLRMDRGPRPPEPAATAGTPTAPLSARSQGEARRVLTCGDIMADASDQDAGVLDGLAKSVHHHALDAPVHLRGEAKMGSCSREAQAARQPPQGLGSLGSPPVAPCSATLAAWL